MKIKRLILFLAMIICMLAYCLVGCVKNQDTLSDNTINNEEFEQPVSPAPTDTSKTPDNVKGPESPVSVEPAVENEIKSAFAQKYNVSENTVSIKCYGVFNECYALMIDCTCFDYAAVITYDTCGPVIFTYSSSHTMDVYYDGNFYKLPSAYEDGLLDNNNLRVIALNVSNVRVLSDTLETQIIDCYFDDVKNNDVDKEEIAITSYYGYYNGYSAVSVGVAGTAPYKDVVEMVNRGLSENSFEDKIVFVNPFGIQLYKDGNLFSLKYAVENNLISLNDYRTISSINGFRFKS